MNAYENMDASMTCQKFNALLPAYRAGKTSAAQSRTMELHASACDACEALMDAASAVPVAAFAPEPPSELRDLVMASVGGAPRGNSRRWGVAGVALAAAATVLIFLRVPAPDVTRDSTRAGGESTSVAMMGDTVQTGAALAEARARPELAEIDRAASEVEAALAASPGDRELQSFLASIKARRDELTQRVKDAKS